VAQPTTLPTRTAPTAKKKPGKPAVVEDVAPTPSVTPPPPSEKKETPKKKKTTVDSSETLDPFAK
jgi:hypothetical protein